MILINIKKNKKYYSELLDEWLLDRKESVKESSYIKYETIINNLIKPQLGQIDIKKITEKTILEFFKTNKIQNTSNSTKKIILIIINSTIKYGNKKKYLKKINKISIPIKTKHKVNYFTKVEQEILDNYLQKNLNLRNLGILLALYTGLRIGELCGLKWQDVDFINKTLSVNRTVQRIKNNNKNISKKTVLITSTPKTEHSKRIIPLPEFLINILKEYASVDEYYIFTNSVKPKDPRAYEKYFASTLKKCSIRNLNFHALRHTFATISREAGIDIKVLSEILGHSSYHITQEIYVHISVDFKRDSIDSLVNYLKINN